MSNRYFAKKPDEKRVEAKGPRRISKRGSPNRRVIVSKGDYALDVGQRK